MGAQAPLSSAGHIPPRSLPRHLPFQQRQGASTRKLWSLRLLLLFLAPHSLHQLYGSSSGSPLPELPTAKALLLPDCLKLPLGDCVCV